MHSKKGFISFIFFFILSLILISTPFSQFNQDSLFPTYSSKITYNNHIHLKRALIPSTTQALTKTKLTLAFIDASKITTLLTGPVSISTQKLSTQLKDDIIRLNVLTNFLDLTTEHKKLTSSNSYIYCNSSLPQSPLPNYFITNDSSIISLWASCAPNIEIQHTKNSTILKIKDGFYLHTSHSQSKTQMNSKILPFEVIQ